MSALTDYNQTGGATASHVVLTGVTGFVGKVVLSRLLLRKDVDTIWCLVRTKTAKGKTYAAQQRVDTILQNTAIFNTKDIARVRAVEISDLSDDAMGIGGTHQDILALKERTDIIIHCAASVSFTEPIDVAFRANVQASVQVARFATECPHLVSWVHTSTAYACGHTSANSSRDTDRSTWFSGSLAPRRTQWPF